MIPLVTLTREPLQLIKADAIGYGAKDTGEMGGGAAAAVLMAAGTEILPELRSKLAVSSFRVGDVIVTPSFKLQASGVLWVFHIVSIIKHTPQGAYCPEPERLKNGVRNAMASAAKLGVRSMAISALGTGEGRVAPSVAASYMLDGVREFRQTGRRAEQAVIFSLPSFRDYEAFSAVI